MREMEYGLDGLDTCALLLGPSDDQKKSNNIGLAICSNICSVEIYGI